MKCRLLEAQNSQILNLRNLESGSLRTVKSWIHKQYLCRNLWRSKFTFPLILQGRN